MAAFERSAQIVWKGGLADGEGSVSTGSGALSFPVTWSARVEDAGGNTSPEELVAAAHAACYAMAFSHTLGTAGHPPEELDVSAVVAAELGDDGLKVLSSDLTVRGRVPGLDQSEFERLAIEAEGSCPISNALRGGIDVRVNATLAE